MSTSTSGIHRYRWALPTPRTPTRQFRDFLQRPFFWQRLLVALAAILLMFLVARGWESAFPYRIRQIPQRKLAAYIEFEVQDREATREAIAKAKSKIACLYENDLRLLEEVRQALIDEVFQVKDKPLEELESTAWPRFYPVSQVTPGAPAANVEPDKRRAELEQFKAALKADERLESLRGVLTRAFLEIDATGLLESLEHDLTRGSMLEIQVYRKGDPETTRTVEVSKVRIAEAADVLRKNLTRELEKENATFPESALLAERLYQWLRPRLPVTLKWNDEASRRESEAAGKKVETKLRLYKVGDPLQHANLTGEKPEHLGGQPLVAADLELLEAEHQAAQSQTKWYSTFARSLLFFLSVGLAIGLVAAFLWKQQPQLLTNLRHFSVIVGAFAAAFCGAWLLAGNLDSRLEIIPLVLGAMVIAIAYQVELAVLLMSLVALMFTVLHGYDLSEFLILSAGVAVSALSCRNIRSRAKSVYVGLLTGAVVLPIAIFVPFLLGWRADWAMVVDALWFGGSAAAAGLIMTALLPFFERWFDFQTDINLLELSDPNHPLLKQLIQRAPGTYNHSINVASIAEAAAESVGANGLLCRVGAYFHDIGKMRKPEYFVENQLGGENKHDDLVPTMSTIVIISHVKDGIELARLHHLPRRIVDLIEQHHGTTLVEYFFHRATRTADEDCRPMESDFRYPGPRPQTIEAAIVMLADAVEGASRTLREPTPHRIESIVRELTKRRVDDGQFDDCPITLQQLHLIQDSLIKSLNAMFHARVKYPEQATG
jgi:putative nucleotidyltransferase with HDIG domain